jgi:predicted RNA-binding protein
MSEQPEQVVEIEGQLTIEDVIEIVVEGGDNGLHEAAVQV